jgi:hypothetical protein
MKNPIVWNRNLREKVGAALILIGLLVVYYNSVVLRGNSFMTTIERSYQLGHYHYSGTYWHEARRFPTLDPTAANQINLPSAYLENHYLKKFQLPLWNPYSGLGRPYHADMNSYTFFLPIYPFKLFPSLIMYDSFLLFRIFISGFFLFLLLRLFKCQFWIAVAGASFYMFNSHFHAFIDMDHINVTLFLSPMAYFLTQFSFSTNKRYLLGFIFCSAGSFYGGNPNEFILIHLFITVYFVFLTFARKPFNLERKFRFLFSYVLALNLSLLLLSLKLIPFVEFWKNSVSSRDLGLLGTSDFLTLKKFFSWLLFPNQMVRGPNYIGYLIFSLLLYSLFNLARKKWKLREKVLAFHFVFLFLVTSKVVAAPYINWIGTLPIFNSINYVKYSSLIYYTVSFISSFSLVYLLEDIKKKKDKIIKVVLFVSACALPHLLLWRVSRKSLFQLAESGTILVGVFIVFISTSIFLISVKKTNANKGIVNAGVIVLMLLAVFELRVNNPQYYRKRFKINDKAPYTQFLLEQKQPYRAIGTNGTLFPNCNLVYPIPTVNRIFAMRVMRPTMLLSKLISDKFNSGMGHLYFKDEILNNPYLDLVNTKYYISESIMDSIVIDPDYAKSHKMEALLDNPSMGYTHCGNLYYYTHWGWQQFADSSVDIPVRLPYGDIHLKATGLAFNFDWKRREDPDNRLILTISMRKGNEEEVIFSKGYAAHHKENQDFFNMKANLTQYAGQNVVLNFHLKNPGAKNINDRMFFFGDLRITFNKIKKRSPLNSKTEGSLGPTSFETVPYEDVFSHHAIVYRNNRASERGFVLYDVKKIEGYNEALSIMKDKPLVYKKTALVEGNFPQDMNVDKAGQSKVSFIDYRANYIKIDVETTENGVFILSDTYYPGWKAYLNGEQVKIYPAFIALRAVYLPKGRHQLVFCYRPWTFSLGAILTFLSIVFLGYLYFSNSKLSKKFFPVNPHKNM